VLEQMLTQHGQQLQQLELLDTMQVVAVVVQFQELA
jgi:hypothetical protein